MSKADYPYADDEFDAPTGPDVPRGVHRAPRSAWSRWWPFLAVIIIVPLVAYALVTYASRDNGTDDDTASTGTTTSATPKATTPSDDSTDSSTDSSIDKATDEATEPSDTSSDEPSDEPTDDTATAEVQLDTPVVVLNAAGINGLAAKTVTTLKGEGFTAAKAENFSGTKPDASVVYFASDDLSATADKVADTLGIDDVQQSSTDAGAGISVVLRTAPQG